MYKRKFEYYIMLFAVTAAAVFINLAVNSLNGKLRLKFDITPNRIFELSDSTKNYLDIMNGSVTFYYLTEHGKESPYVREVLDRYAAYGKNIRTETVDIIGNPMSVAKYSAEGEALSKGSIVVESAKRFTVVDSGSALAANRDAKGNITQELGFSLEQKLTNAIDFVLRDKNISVKYTQNHGEADFRIPASKLKSENIEVGTVDLKKENLDADNTDLLVLFGLRTDITEEEKENIENYLTNGGKLFIASNPAVSCPLIDEIAENYALSLNDDAVTETNASDIIENNKLYLTVKPMRHKITESFSDRGKILFPAARSVEINEKSGFKTEYLLKTNNTAAARKLGGGSLGDTIRTGEIGIAALSENEENHSMIFLTGTTQFLVSADPALGNILENVNYTNLEFFVGTVKYMTDSEGMLVSVSPKNIAVKSISLTPIQQTALTVIFGIIFPLSVIGAGAAVWFRRKNL